MIPDEKKPIPWGLPPLAAPASVGTTYCAEPAGKHRGGYEPLEPAGVATTYCAERKSERKGGYEPLEPAGAGQRARRAQCGQMVALVCGLALACGGLLYAAVSAATCPMLGGRSAAAVPAATRRAVEGLLAAGLDGSNTVAWDRLAEMTDLYGPRMTGSDAYDRSARWVVDTANAQDGGLAARTEPVWVNAWQRNGESLRLLAPTRPGGGVDVGVLGLGNSVGTGPGGIEADVVPVRSFEELARLGNATVAGKVVLFNFAFTTYAEAARFRARGAAEAERFGARAVLVRTLAPDSSFASVHTGSSVRAAIPAASVSLADANLIERMYRRAAAGLPGHAAPRVRLVMNAQLREHARESANVVIDLRGTDLADEVVLLSGHFDSWDVGVGAMDDGAGAFLAWEALRLIAAAGRPPRRTVRAVMWNNEETLQLGAKAYFARHRAEIPKHRFAVESDIGVFEPWGLTVAAPDDVVCRLSDYGSSLLRPLGAGNVTLSTAGAPGADISILCSHGVPCAGFLSLNPENGAAPGEPHWEDHYFRHHHAASDRIEAIDKHQLRRSAAALAAWAYLIADT
ncbi:hypothetical protein H4R18_000926 [Coemansia javaensis]|uniref:Peptide hydrolase n=1 Tax=Coemansia javaensis TaxID=2761396 RepID=A0A9W8HH01_9FUNG|nr:hypothetical protein H4R18_000926 [Coemansia javaensis]